MNMHGEMTKHLKTVPIFECKLIDATIFLTKKGCFYHDLVSENCFDGKKLWQALNRILSWSNTSVLLSFNDGNH